MSEKILFRGKALQRTKGVRLDSGWMYGVPVPIKSGNRMTKRIEMVKYHRYSFDEFDNYELFSQGCEVDPKTIGQFVGVLDKNRKHIFEGDIVRKTNDDGRHPKVFIANMYSDFSPVEKVYYSPFDYQIESCTYEIIGNIHDGSKRWEGNLNG